MRNGSAAAPAPESRVASPAASPLAGPVTSPAKTMIRITDLTLGYNRHPAVHHLDGTFAQGSLTAVVGPNGAGKSTLLKGLMGALRPLSGAIRIGRSGRRDIAYLPQQAELDLSFPITIMDTVCLGLWAEVGLLRAIGRERLARAEAALATVGLERFEKRTVGTLSGGQLQRVLFARLLLQDAPLILLDEPFTAIDTRTIADLLQLILRWHGEGRTIVAVLHNLDLVHQHFPDALLLAREPIAWGSTPAVLTAANLGRARQLCQSWDEAAALCPSATR